MAGNVAASMGMKQMKRKLTRNTLYASAMLDINQEEVEMDRGPVFLPPPEERILSDILEKKAFTSRGLSWQSRFAVLSKDYLVFAKTRDKR